MKSLWNAWIESNKEPAAERVARRLLEELGVTGDGRRLERYDEGGFVLSFEVPLEAQLWPDATFQLLSLAQQVGYGWRLLGSIDSDISLVVSTSGGGSVRVSGVTMIECQLDRATSSPAP